MLFSRIAFTTLVVISSSSALADRLKEEWQARYYKLSKIICSRDLKAFTDYLAPDYVWIQPGGVKRTRAQAIGDFGEMFKAKAISGGEKVVGVRRVADTVEVKYDARWTLTGVDGKVSKFHEKGVDTWRLTGKAWKVIKTLDEVSESG